MKFNSKIDGSEMSMNVEKDGKFVLNMKDKDYEISAKGNFNAMSEKGKALGQFMGMQFMECVNSFNKSKNDKK